MRKTLVASVIVAAFLMGCGDPVLYKRVIIEQVGTTHTPNQIEVDLQQVPKDWIISREQKDWGTFDHIQFGDKHAVKIVVVPVESH